MTNDPNDPSGINSSGGTRPRPANRKSYEPLTDEVLTHIQSEMARTGKGAMTLLRGASNKPTGLTSTIIDSWVSGRVRNAKPLHVCYVMACFAALPSNRYHPLTADMSAVLEAELVRTGMGAVTFLKRRADLPKGLTRQVILGWLNRTTHTISETHCDYVTSRLKSLPDSSSQAKSLRVGRMMREAIDPRELAELRAHRERTGIGGAILLRNATDKPKALTPTMISSWLSGKSKTADPAHFAYALARYRAWP